MCIKVNVWGLTTQSVAGDPFNIGILLVNEASDLHTDIAKKWRAVRPFILTMIPMVNSYFIACLPGSIDAT